MTKPVTKAPSNGFTVFSKDVRTKAVETTLLLTTSALSEVIDVSLHLDPSIIWTLESELSTDGGKTWKSIGGATRQGGVTLDRDTGLPLTTATIATSFDPPLAKDVMLRNFITVSGSGGASLKVSVA